MKIQHGFILAVGTMLMISGCYVNDAQPEKKPTLLEAKWDLSKSNDISAVDWPLDMKDKDGIASLGGPRKVSLTLANGKTIATFVDEVCAEKRGQRIWWIGLYYPQMTLKEAVDTASQIASVLDYNSTRIGDWFKETSKERNPGPIFEENFHGKKHSLGIKILHSYVESRPWWTKATIFFE